MIQVDLLRIFEKAPRDFSSESNLSKRKGPKWKDRIRRMTPHLPNLLQYSAPSLKEKAAVRLQTTWNKIHQQWVVLWLDKWYNKQFTTNPDKNDKSLNAIALAVLLLKDAPHYWHGHTSLEELERRVPVVARMLGNTEGTFARILRDLGFASTRPVVRDITAPPDIIRPVPAKRPHWRPLCLSQEKVSGNVLLLNLLQFTRDLAQHTRPVVPV